MPKVGNQIARGSSFVLCFRSMGNDGVQICAKHHRPLICPSCESEKAARKTMSKAQRKARARNAARVRWAKAKAKAEK
jgi:hypothetical protein